MAELAPAVAVRAACFPLDRLLGLVDAELAGRCRGQVEGDRAPAELEAAYEASIAGQRARLAQLTLEDPRFQRALCITNQELSRRVASMTAFSARRNKRARHLETTLYRYLARAVWRTAPCDLWSGLTLATWADGEATQVRAQPARYAFAPDLRPFQTMIQALASTDAYRGAGLYRLNPTLSFADGGWHYRARRSGGRLDPARLPSRPGLDLLLRSLHRRPPASLERIRAELAGSGRLDAANLDVALAALVDAGVLIGGLAFPVRFSSAWAALFACARDLIPEQARAWRGAIRRLRRICWRLEREIDDTPIEALHGALDRARAETLELAATLGLAPPKLPRSILRADLRLAFAIAFGTETRLALEAAAVEYDAFDAALGLDAAVRAAHRSRLLADRAAAARRGGSDPLVGQRLRRLSAWLTSATGPRGVSGQGASQGRHATRVIDPWPPAAELPLPPLGAVILRPARGGYVVGGNTTEIVATYGRYGALWRGAAEELALHRWYRSALTATARRAGIDLVEYVGPCEPAPNGLARPDFDLAVLAPWTSIAGLELGEWQVAPDAGGGAPLLFSRDHSRPLSVLCLTPLDVAQNERDLERILLTSFRENPTWIRPGLPLECELADAGRSARLTLESGNLIRPHRTVLHGDELADLVRAGRAMRFVRWQALARKHGWAQLLLLTRDARQPLLVLRDSPLALEAALEGVGEGVTFLCIEEPNEEAWLTDGSGNRYITEFILPFLRRRHAWSDLARGQRAAS